MDPTAPVPSGAERAPALLVSIVSHGHGVWVQRLLHQLAHQSAASISRVVLTHNIAEPLPEPPQRGWPFALEIVRNAAPRGFGANHNQALRNASEPFVCVLNPDVELFPGQDPFAEMIDTAALDGVGCAYPLQLDAQARVQDSEREIPSPLALWQRRVLHQPQTRVEWVNAACIVLPLPVWQSVKGFDEAYFMYCEDVDLSLRIRLLGLRLQRADARILHEGQRASGRQWRHLAWHVGSLLRLWSSDIYRRARKLPCGNRLQ